MTETAAEPLITPFAYDRQFVISVNVSNFEAAAEWYREALGFEVVYRLDEYGWGEVRTPWNGVTIGIGRSSRIRRAASMPSSFGIFTSMIATSGSRSSASATASSPSRASATTSMPARRSSSTRSSRMIVSSSATRTRMRGGYPRSAFDMSSCCASIHAFPSGS